MNAAVCFAVVRAPFYTRWQIALQFILVWLLPVFGAVLVGAVLRSQRPAERQLTAVEPEQNTGTVLSWPNADYPGHSSVNHGHGA